jgi:cell division septation protein DedD
VDITAFIRELLFGHDCVIVPGFGGFIGNYTPARIDKPAGTFYPPVKQISFNRNLNHNDGLLIGRISNTSGMNYGDTRKLVEEFVSDIRKRLEKGEKIKFDNIGSFVNNHEGNIQFEPDRTVNYHLDSYGLEPFVCMPLESYDVRKRIVRQKNMEPVPQLPTRKILWRAAVIIPLLSILVIVPLKTDIFKSKAENSTMNPLVTAEFESNKKAVDDSYIEPAKIDSAKTETVEQISPSTETSDQKVSETVIAEPVDKPEITKPTPETVIDKPAAKPESVKKSPEVTAHEVSQSDSYFVITGSFKSRKYALSQSDRLREAGFTPEIEMADNGFYRVCALSCNNLKTAMFKKDSIMEKFPGSWVSRNK